MSRKRYMSPPRKRKPAPKKRRVRDLPPVVGRPWRYIRMAAWGIPALAALGAVIALLFF